MELQEPDILDSPASSDAGLPPLYGKCPVCHKPLFPRNKKTGEMQAPPVGRGYESRARCGGCGTIIQYIGRGEWAVLTNADLTESDTLADLAGRD